MGWCSCNMREEVYSLNNVTANFITYSDSILEAANNRWSDSRDPDELRLQRNNIGGHLLYQTIASLWCLWKISPVWKCTPRICFVFHIQIAELNFIRFIWIWQTICHRANGLQLEVYFVSIKTGRHWVVWLLFSKTCVDCCKSNRLIRLQQAGAVRQKLTGSDNLSQSVWQGAPSGLTRTRSTTGTEGMPKLWWNVINWMISISNSQGLFLC